MEEKAFQRMLEKVRGSLNRDELADAVQSGLERTLTQPGHGQLLAELQTKAANITKNLPAGDARTPPAEIRQAAVRCTLLLETAQKRAGPFTKPKSWRKPVLSSLAAATVLLYLVLLMIR